MTSLRNWLVAILLVAGFAACSDETEGTGDCQPGEYRDCYTGPDGTRDVGICRAGIAFCDAEGQWGPCLDEQVPMAESCFGNLDDEDCDGLVNEEGAGCAWQPDFEWGLLVGSAGAESVSAVAADNSGNVFVASLLQGDLTIGDDTFSSPSGADSILMKLDSEGNYVWGVQVGDGPTGADEQWIDAMAVDDDDSVIIVGRFMGNFNLGGDDLASSTHDDVFLAKFSEDGDHLWSWQLSCTLCTNASTGDKQAYDIALAGDLAVVVGKYTGGFGNPGGCLDGMCKLPTAADDDPFVLLIEAETGNYMETTYFTGSGTQYAKKVAIDGNGDIVIAGYFVNDHDVLPGVVGGNWNSMGYADVFLTKLDADLIPLWHRTLGTSGTDLVQALALDLDDNPVVVATLADELNGDTLLVVKYSKDSMLMGPMGVQEWPLLSRHYADNLASSVDAVGAAVGPDGNLFLGGTFWGSLTFEETTLISHGGSDGYVVMLDQAFEPVWAKSFGSTADDNVLGFSLGPDRAIVVGGRATEAIDFGDGPEVFGGLMDGFVGTLSP